MIVLEYPNIKTFLQKVMLQIVFRMITKDKNTALWAYVISTLDIEWIVPTFYKKELQKTNQKRFRAKNTNKEIMW